ncbi:CU044_2847 family protein [Streptomyces odonnellii]|uniref:CU044_2847 family protein n=1 Tax=Streptomyces odonnellii TaxID=1417980 RepID=UPI000625EA1C|nr:CU044_2847 family protein [Streptomyces odonnellii]
MPYVGELRLADGTSVPLEIAEGEGGGISRAGRGGAQVGAVADTLQEALDLVRPALNAMVERVRDLAHPPDTVAVDFGVKLTAEAGVVVAKAATEANFTVHLEWHTDRPA